MSIPQSNDSIADVVLHETQAIREQLLNHELYNAIQDSSDLQIFMQHHVFAVLDFMWLLKRLQKEICGCNVPWLPPREPQLTRFVNEIVLGEESDEDGEGNFSSHFNIYLSAMDDVLAPTTAIDNFVENLRGGQTVSVALKQAQIPETVKRFVSFNHELAVNGSASEVAAAFCFGREDIIPDMFQRLLSGFKSAGMTVPRLQHYIERHIELDGDHHGPLSHALVNRVCGTSELSVQEAIIAAQNSITHRIALWDGVLDELQTF
jgi:hypothetical protein